MKLPAVEERAPAEIIRQVRLGHLRRLFRGRYRGKRLPDDDAGIIDLRWLLSLISTGPNAEIKMRNEIREWAPWLHRRSDEADRLIADILNTPIQDRKYRAEYLGRELGLTNAERERRRVWSIYPYDMTQEEMAVWRKNRRRAGQRIRRRQQRQSRLEYLAAHSISRDKPWIAAGFNTRRTWERHGKPNVASVKPLILTSKSFTPATPAQAAPPKGAVRAGTAHKAELRPQPPQQAEMPVKPTVDALFHYQFLYALAAAWEDKLASLRTARCFGSLAGLHNPMASHLSHLARRPVASHLRHEDRRNSRTPAERLNPWDS